MGYNATVVVLLDGLDDIKKDPDFGRKFAEAVMNKANRHPNGPNPEIIHSGNGNVASVVEVHHADSTVTVEVGGNTGRVVPGRRSPGIH
jgi:hypothetical protein